MKILLSIITMLALLSCDRYQVTLNEREIYTPAILFSDFQILDPTLRTCVTQAINDQKINKPQDLKLLNCSYAAIIQLDGLERFTKLETVNFSNNKLADIKPLMFFGDLKRLDLRGNSGLSCKDLRSLEILLAADLLKPQSCQ
jgi:Leucine-rich repeat (LRR) protein